MHGTIEFWKSKEDVMDQELKAGTQKVLLLLPPPPTDGGEGPPTASKTSAPARGRAAWSVPIFFLGFFPGSVPHSLKFMDICKFTGFP